MKITCESAVLADAVNRAARIAPTKGASLDKAAGVLLTVDPVQGTVAIRATDLDSSFLQTVATLTVEGDEPVTWRLPATTLAGFLGSLPLGSGTTVKMADDPNAPVGMIGGEVKITSGKTRAKLRQITGTYPDWEPFDETGLASVPDFTKRLAQVAWAVSNTSGSILSGVHIDGTDLLACDGKKIAIVPLAVPVDRPVTAPLGTLVGLLKATGDVRLRATERRLLLAPEHGAQCSCVLLADQYPNVRAVLRDTFTGTLKVNRQLFESTVNRMLVVVRGEKMPGLQTKIGHNTWSFLVENPDLGRIEDEIEITGGEDEGAEPFRISFTPEFLIPGFTNAGAEMVEVKYGPDSNKTVSIVAPGYRCDVMPRGAA